MVLLKNVNALLKQTGKKLTYHEAFRQRGYLRRGSHVDERVQFVICSLSPSSHPCCCQPHLWPFPPLLINFYPDAVSAEDCAESMGRPPEELVQHRSVIPPLSAPSRSSLFKGSTAIEAMTPRKVSERSFVLEKEACNTKVEAMVICSYRNSPTHQHCLEKYRCVLVCNISVLHSCISLYLYKHLSATVSQTKFLKSVNTIAMVAVD